MAVENREPAGSTSQNRPLYAMFNEVPGRYDLVNTAMTWGLDRFWRAGAADEVLADSPRRVLDLCCGTGDLAVCLAERSRGSAEITGFDFSQPMLDRAVRKAQERGVAIAFTRGDAAAMPFPDGHFDAVGISFAFRNLTYKNPMVGKHLSEMLRVLRPGGRLVIVESAQPSGQPIRAFYHLYLRLFVAGIGSALSGNRPAYRYLAESAARFYTPSEVRSLLLDAGFSQVSIQSRMLGAVGIYTAIK